MTVPPKLTPLAGYPAGRPFRPSLPGPRKRPPRLTIRPFGLQATCSTSTIRPFGLKYFAKFGTKRSTIRPQPLGRSFQVIRSSDINHPAIWPPRYFAKFGTKRSTIRPQPLGRSFQVIRSSDINHPTIWPPRYVFDLYHSAIRPFGLRYFTKFGTQHSTIRPQPLGRSSQVIRSSDINHPAIWPPRYFAKFGTQRSTIRPQPLGRSSQVIRSSDINHPAIWPPRYVFDLYHSALGTSINLALNVRPSGFNLLVARPKKFDRPTSTIRPFGLQGTCSTSTIWPFGLRYLAEFGIQHLAFRLNSRPFGLNRLWKHFASTVGYQASTLNRSASPQPNLDSDVPADRIQLIDHTLVLGIRPFGLTRTRPFGHKGTWPSGLYRLPFMASSVQAFNNSAEQISSTRMFFKNSWATHGH
ncbi:hypothetical protein LR48_Vigan03g022400 [Vigna angularis]|uniref:Uncharacterized protein n=1 Tax=Phaseolus angularis TaxID=3914 RepID=A0A0L9U1Z2_PHAAN|nr:hypothetical protein LR48_Vigan03g022400 [Vigna angularis]